MDGDRAEAAPPPPDNEAGAGRNSESVPVEEEVVPSEEGCSWWTSRKP